MPWKTHRPLPLWTLGLVLFICISPALAGDGVIEINQARALAGSVTPSDTAGFPVTIDAPGSYVLTGNLTLPDAATGAIYITADNVEIDLNGFSILGPCVCTPSYTSSILTAITCTPTGGGGFGILAEGHKETTVYGGTIRGVGGDGVKLAEGALIHDLRVIQNDGAGIVTSGDSIVRNVRADRNDGTGIGCYGGFVDSSFVTRNFGSGVSVAGGTVQLTTVQWSSSYGIQTGYGGRVADCTSIQNGSSGIYTKGQGLVTGNNIRHNAGWGIYLSDGYATGYAGNTIWNNDGGTVFGTGMTEIGTNICQGNTTCP